MNTLNYLQFFDGLAEKRRGIFMMETISSRQGEVDPMGENPTHYCIFKTDDKVMSSRGNSRKEALKRLYRKLSK